jgi:hypothetical protein
MLGGVKGAWNWSVRTSASLAPKSKLHTMSDKPNVFPKGPFRRKVFLLSFLPDFRLARCIAVLLTMR